MNKIFRTINGNTRGGITLTVTDGDGCAVDLEEVTEAKLIVQGVARTELVMSQTEEAGELEYALSAAEEEAIGEGRWKCRLELTYDDGSCEQIPVGGYNYIVIDPAL